MEPGSLLNQTIWYNKSIVSKVAIKGNKYKLLVMKNYLRAGVSKLKDLVNNYGEIRTFTDICKKFNVQTNIMEYFKVIQSQKTGKLLLRTPRDKERTVKFLTLCIQIAS